MFEVYSVVQKVAVFHLEERCERSIQWAVEMEPSVKYLVMCIPLTLNPTLLNIGITFYVRTTLTYIKSFFFVGSIWGGCIK